MEILTTRDHLKLGRLFILSVILLMIGLGLVAFTYYPAPTLPARSYQGGEPPPYYYSPNGYNYYYIPGSGSVTWGFPSPPYSYTTDTGLPWYGYLVCNTPYDCKNIIYDSSYRQLYPPVNVQNNRSFTCNNVQHLDTCWNKYNQELDAYYRLSSRLVCDPYGDCWKSRGILKP